MIHSCPVDSIWSCPRAAYSQSCDSAQISFQPEITQTNSPWSNGFLKCPTCWASLLLWRRVWWWVQLFSLVSPCDTQSATPLGPLGEGHFRASAGTTGRHRTSVCYYYVLLVTIYGCPCCAYISWTRRTSPRCRLRQISSINISPVQPIWFVLFQYISYKYNFPYRSDRIEYFAGLLLFHLPFCWVIQNVYRVVLAMAGGASKHESREETCTAYNYKCPFCS